MARVSPERARRLDAIRRRTSGLRAWREEYGTGAVVYLARETHRTFAAIARIIGGRAQATTETALAIESATRRSGTRRVVTAAELLGIATNGTTSASSATGARVQHASGG